MQSFKDHRTQLGPTRRMDEYSNDKLHPFTCANSWKAKDCDCHGAEIVQDPTCLMQAKLQNFLWIKMVHLKPTPRVICSRMSSLSR